jgi:outer membrane protein TolC
MPGTISFVIPNFPAVRRNRKDADPVGDCAVFNIKDNDARPITQTSLTAFQEVEDHVAALRILENETQQQQEAVASAQESLQLFTNRYKGGVDTYLQVITAQTIELTNERNAIDILRRRLDASVLLIKALGGGWNVSNLPTFGASSVRDY